MSRDVTGGPGNRNDPLLVCLSVVIAVVASGAVLWIV
ncbi:MHYT domain-containing protein, partial [Burkholderia sp.]